MKIPKHVCSKSTVFWGARATLGRSTDGLERWTKIVTNIPARGFLNVCFVFLLCVWHSNVLFAVFLTVKYIEITAFPMGFTMVVVFATQNMRPHA